MTIDIRNTFREEVEYIERNLNNAAMLEQLAEECNELGHAALKLARVIRKENPTPTSMEDAVINLEEEYNDVRIASSICGLDDDYDKILSKLLRWVNRLEIDNE